MKSLQAMYDFEREGIETVETENYFFSYKLVENEFHVIEIFVHPDFRHSMVTFEMMNRIDDLAIEKKSKFIISTVVAGMPHSEKSLMLQFRWKMKLLKCEGNTIFLMKEVNHG